MELKIYKARPDFCEVGHDKRVVMVEFPNCISTTTNKTFKWIPTYRQLVEIRQALNEIELESWQSDCGGV